MKTCREPRVLGFLRRHALREEYWGRMNREDRIRLRSPACGTSKGLLREDEGDRWHYGRHKLLDRGSRAEVHNNGELFLG